MSLRFGLRGPRDLFEKLKRDAALLDDEVTSDRFFNFVVTGYSLIDWVKNDDAVPAITRSAVVGMRDDHVIRVCGDLATASKHFVLTRRSPITSEAVSQQGYGLGGYGKGGWGVGEEKIRITLNDGMVINGLELARNVLDVWERFFAANGL